MADNSTSAAILLRELLLEKHPSAVSPKLTLRATEPDGDRSFFAKETIHAGEVLVHLPRDLLLVGEWEAPDFHAVRSAFADDPNCGTALMVARILHEDRRARTHQDMPQLLALFLATLPESIDSPYTWQAPEVTALAEHHRVLSLLSENKRSMIDLWNKLKGCLGPAPTWPDFQWAYTIKASRAFQMSCVADGSTRPCLAPFADMFNHSPLAGDTTSYSINDADGLKIKCLKEIATGDEVCITYGCISNDALLVTYGFALAITEEASGYCPDEAELRIPVTQENRLRLALLQKSDYKCEDGFIRMVVTSARSLGKLMSVLRVVAADDGEIQLIIKNKIKQAHDVRGISLQNEHKALALLGSLCCAQCAGLDSGTQIMLHAFSELVQVVSNSLLLPPSLAAPEEELPHSPAIIQLMRDALESTAAGSSARRGSDDARVSDLVAGITENLSEDESSRVPDAVRLPAIVRRLMREAQTNRRTEVAQRVVASDRRLFAYFVALAATAKAVMRLEPNERAKVLPHIEKASALRGLTATSRHLIATLARNLCEFYAQPLGDRS